MWWVSIDHHHAYGDDASDASDVEDGTLSPMNSYYWHNRQSHCHHVVDVVDFVD